MMVIASQGRVMGSGILYGVQILSFAAAIYSLPYIKDFVAPYLINYAWGVTPASIIIAWALMVFLVPEVLYFIIASALK